MRAAVDWVDVLLARWGRWALRRHSGALGYATSSVLAVSGDGDGYDSAIPRGVADRDLEEVDSIVMTLPIVQVGCLIVVYQLGAGRSDRDNAARAGITRKMLTQYIHDAQRKIALDMGRKECQNPRHYVNGGTAPTRIQPAQA